MPKYRYFAHKEKFGDDTRYLRIGGTGRLKCVLFLRDGGQNRGNAYTLASCLSFVKRGVWREVTRYQASRIK